MRVLVTGGQGQLGIALQAALGAHDVLAPGHADLDVTDRESVRRAFAGHRPDAVIHAAAWTDTAGCESDPDRAMLVNGDASRIVAETCREAGASMLYVSTNEVFDGEKDEPYLEDDPVNPLNHYARSKLAGEQAVRDTLERYAIVRTSWLYGPGRKSFPEKVLDAVREKPRLRLVTDETASPTLTGDLAHGIAALLNAEGTGVYHLTNSGYCSREDWGREVLRLAGLDVEVERATRADFGGGPPKPRMSALANRAAAALGITLRPWQDALAEHFQRSGVRASSPGRG